ncbi:MAG: cytochrome c3 family protein [FCB group bacterium]|jgi:hypothetical protein|nr:cytochrome c3 family protein [FCB group bacterium]
MVQRSAKFWLAAGALVIATSVLFGACAAQKEKAAPVAKEDHGIKFSHAHEAHKELGCTDCHAIENAKAAMPGHDQCGICHEINMDAPDEQACGFCHTREGFEILERKTFLDAEIKFSHQNHVDKQVECASCHADPDKAELQKVTKMAVCMDCHGKTNPALNECNVCHTEITRDTIPKFRGETRIQHDAPVIWEKIHGQESRVDMEYCAMCHDQQNSCDACHQENPPQNHTVSFRRSTHGLQATWDRNKCAACHEEDSCRKCHENTAPKSHRGGWGGITNTHCVSCHFPPQDNNCTVCHEDIEHKSALPSPHDIGVYPARCGVCHPAGNPYRAPHLMNTTVRCAWCHH